MKKVILLSLVSVNLLTANEADNSWSKVKCIAELSTTPFHPNQTIACGGNIENCFMNTDELFVEKIDQKVISCETTEQGKECYIENWIIKKNGNELAIGFGSLPYFSLKTISINDKASGSFAMQEINFPSQESVNSVNPLQLKLSLFNLKGGILGIKEAIGVNIKCTDAK